MPTSFNLCTPVYRTVGSCGATIPCGIQTVKNGNTQPFPYVNDLSYHREIRRYKPGAIKNVNGNTYDFDCVWGGVSFDYPSDPNVMIRLIGNLASEVRGHDFNLGVSLGEGREAIQMIGNSAHQLARLAMNLRRKSNPRKRAKKLVSVGSQSHELIVDHLAASTWLQAVYGWMPLFNDMKNGAEFLASSLSTRRRTTYRAIARTTGVVTSASPSNWSAKGSCSKLYYVVARIEEKTQRSLAFNGQLDIKQIAWELTPYSFVADWFIPIGSWLEARSFLAELEAKGCWGIFTKEYGTVATVLNPNNVLLSPQKTENIVLDRVPALPSLPPLPSFTPLSRVFSNWRHMTDGLALAVNAFSGIKLKW